MNKRHWAPKTKVPVVIDGHVYALEGESQTDGEGVVGKFEDICPLCRQTRAALRAANGKD